MTKPKPTKCALSAQEICDIIRACGEQGVAELKFGDLQVVFPPKWGSWPGQKPLSFASSSEAALSEAQTTQIAAETLEKEAISLKEDQLAELALTDPLEYERLLSEGELYHAKSHGVTEAVGLEDA
jgi:hypothetical protein